MLQSHHCQATFTTSGHAARHGKKHTGEKGVHCPVCNKAFTRKDNMKQHERTHKGQSTSSSTSDESARRSKAAITKDAQRAKQLKKEPTGTTDASRRSSLIHSPLSEVTSIAATAIDTPLNVDESTFFAEPSQVLMPIQAIPESLSPSSLYPPLSEDTLLSLTPLGQTPVLSKNIDPQFGLGYMPAMPPLTRGISDLDTLALRCRKFRRCIISIWPLSCALTSTLIFLMVIILPSVGVCYITYSFYCFHSAGVWDFYDHKHDDLGQRLLGDRY